MANLFEGYALLLNILAFVLLALVCIPTFVVLVCCAGEYVRVRSRRARRRVIPLVQVG
jgi:hypothetical protein